MKHATPGRTCAWGFLTLLASVQASAQDPAANYPNRPITIIAIVSPGGAGETQARIYIPKLTENLGRPFIFDYKPGAGGSVGFAATAKAAPDGYTLVAATPAFSTLPAVMANLPYDPIKDFAPVVQLSSQLGMLAVHPSVPFTTMQEYVAYARANPGKLNWGTPGAGSTGHLVGAWLNDITRTNTTFVHYKGPQLFTDLMSGIVQATANGIVNIAPLVKAGKLRALAIPGPVRSQAFPDVPTAKEQGVDFDYPSWMGIIAPAGTPIPIVNKLNAEFIKVQKLPETLKLLEKASVMPVSGTPAEFARLLADEIGRWKRLVKQLDIKIEG